MSDDSAAEIAEHLSLSTRRSRALAKDIEERLLELATRYISKNARNEAFLRDPDSAAEHSPGFHQYGIITHTKKVRECYLREAPTLLSEWGLADKVSRVFGERSSSGWSRGELFEVSIPLHDLGKFGRSFFYRKGAWRPNYGGHEALSEQIVKEDSEIQDLLMRGGLSHGDSERVAALAGVHFELGKVRDTARSRGSFSLAFARSAEARRVYAALKSMYPLYAAEIGIWYLVDSLGKHEFRFEAETDDELERRKEAIEGQVLAAGVPLTLTRGVMQLPINLEVSREYLTFVL